MDAIKRHWDIRSSDYNDFVVRGFSIDRERRSWQEHFTSILGTEPLDILDVGCGPGIVSMQLADLGHRMTSVDLSDRMLEYARENARANGLDIDFRQADAMALPFGDGSFEAVVSDYMLWTVPDPEKRSQDDAPEMQDLGHVRQTREGKAQGRRRAGGVRTRPLVILCMPSRG